MPSVATNSTGPKQLWALVEWNEYVENHTVFKTANGTSLDADAAAQHDYFGIVGVPVKNWTYSAAKPTEEPEGFRWISLEAGFGLKVRL